MSDDWIDTPGSVADDVLRAKVTPNSMLPEDLQNLGKIAEDIRHGRRRARTLKPPPPGSFAERVLAEYAVRSPADMIMADPTWVNKLAMSAYLEAGVKTGRIRYVD